jgi:hypothetical protein
MPWDPEVPRPSFQKPDKDLEAFPPLETSKPVNWKVWYQCALIDKRKRGNRKHKRGDQCGAVTCGSDAPDFFSIGALPASAGIPVASLPQRGDECLTQDIPGAHQSRTSPAKRSRAALTKARMLAEPRWLA